MGKSDDVLADPLLTGLQRKYQFIYWHALETKLIVLALHACMHLEKHQTGRYCYILIPVPKH